MHDVLEAEPWAEEQRVNASDSAPVHAGSRRGPKTVLTLRNIPPHLQMNER